MRNMDTKIERGVVNRVELDEKIRARAKVLEEEGSLEIEEGGPLIGKKDYGSPSEAQIKTPGGR